VITTYKNTLVYFYIPWCSHSQQLMSTFQKVYKKFYKKKAAVKFGKINGYINKKYSQQLQLRGYPAIILFKGSLDNYTIYNTDTAVSDFRRFIDTNIFSKIFKFSDHEKYEKSRRDFEIVFLGDKEKYSNIYSYFIDRSKTSPLYRYVYLEGIEEMYWTIALEF